MWRLLTTAIVALASVLVTGARRSYPTEAKRIEANHIEATQAEASWTSDFPRRA